MQSLLSKLKNPKKITRPVTKSGKGRKTKKGADANSADSVLYNELDRMEKYISENNKKKIKNLKTALLYGVEEIGSDNDPAGILKDNLIPETSRLARLEAAKQLFKKYADNNKEEEQKITFYSKYRYYKKISYTRKGKTISYSAGYDARTGRRVKINKRLKNNLRRKKR